MRGITVMAWGSILMAGCRIGFEPRIEGDADVDAPVGSFTIGGTASGLASEGLVLQLNGADDLALRMDGAFQFATAIVDASAYEVTIKAMPAGLTCVIANQAGVIAGAPIADVEVTCFPIGACPAVPLTFVSNGTFTVPEGCTAFTVAALGGGGAGGGKNAGSVAAAGGNGGRAVATFTNLVAGTAFTITIGQGGRCESTVATPGAFAGGAGGEDSGFGDGADGDGASAPPGGLGGAGSVGAQPGGAGGNGGYGGGGGGGGGDKVFGNSGGGATAFRLTSPVTNYVIAGGGGGAGAADQNGDVAGAGGAACNGSNGANGSPIGGGARSGGGGGGGACACPVGACDAPPTPTGGAGGIAATSGACTPAQNGAGGRIVITFPSS